MAEPIFEEEGGGVQTDATIDTVVISRTITNTVEKFMRWIVFSLCIVSIAATEWRYCGKKKGNEYWMQ